MTRNGRTTGHSGAPRRGAVRRRFRPGAAAFALLAILLLPGAVRADVVVELLDAAAVEGDFIRLRDVAELSGDADRAERLGNIYLGRAPRTGAAREIARAWIRERLGELGYARAVVLRGADSVLVRRRDATREEKTPDNAEAGETVVRDDAPADTRWIVAAIRDYMRRQVGREDVDVTVELGRVESDIPGAARGEVREVVSGRLPGHGQILLAVLDDTGRELGAVRVRAEVTVSGEVLMLRRSLRRGDRIRAGDLYAARSAFRPGEVYLHPGRRNDVAGAVASRSLRATTPLALGDLEAPDLVKKNQVVVVDSRVGGFRIRHYAKALDDGKLDEAVLVQNLDSGKRYAARVTGRGTVAVAHGGGSR